MSQRGIDTESFEIPKMQFNPPDERRQSLTSSKKFLVDYSSDESADESGDRVDEEETKAETSKGAVEFPTNNDDIKGSKENDRSYSLHLPVSSDHQTPTNMNITRNSGTNLNRGYNHSIVSSEMTSDREYMSALSEMASNESEERESYYFNSNLSPQQTIQTQKEEYPGEKRIEEEDNKDEQGLNTFISASGFDEDKIQNEKVSQEEAAPELLKQSSISTLIRRRSSIPMLKDFYYDSNMQQNEESKQQMRRKSNSQMIYKLLVNESTSTTDLGQDEPEQEGQEEYQTTSKEESSQLTETNDNFNNHGLSTPEESESIVLPHRSNSGTLRRRASRISQSIKRYSSVRSNLNAKVIEENELSKSENIEPVNTGSTSLKRSNATRRKIGWMSQLLSLLSELRLKINKKWRNLKGKRVFKLKRSGSSRQKKKKDQLLTISNPKLVSKSTDAENNNLRAIYPLTEVQAPEKLFKIVEEEGSVTESFSKSLNKRSKEYEPADIKFQNMDKYLEGENTKVLDRIEEKRQFSNLQLINKEVSKSTQETILADKESEDEIEGAKDEVKGVSKEFLEIWSHYLKSIVKNRIQMRIEIDEITVPVRTRYSYLLESTRPDTHKMIIENEIRSNSVASTTGGHRTATMNALSQNSGVNARLTEEALKDFQPPHRFRDNRRGSVLHSIISDSDSANGSSASSFYSDKDSSISDQTSVSSFNEHHQFNQSNDVNEETNSPEISNRDTIDSNEVIITRNLHLKYAKESLLERRESVFSVDSKDNNYPIVVGTNNEDLRMMSKLNNRKMINKDHNRFSADLSLDFSLLSASESDSETEMAVRNAMLIEAATRNRASNKGSRNDESLLEFSSSSGKRNTKLIKQLERFMSASPPADSVQV